MAEPDPKYVVKSVAKAMTLLQLLEKQAGTSGMSLTDLAQQMKMSKSSTFALLQTLASFGVVTTDPTGTQNRNYRLGLSLVRLGQHAATQTTVADVCLPELRSLSKDTRLTARVAVLDHGWAVAVARVDAPDSVRLDLRLGEKEWPHRSGLGKALMSVLPDDEVRRYLEEIGMPANTAKTLTTVDAYLADLKVSRERGYATDDEEDAEGIICIAAPIRDADGRPFAAISVTGVKIGVLQENPASVAELVREHASRVEQRLQPVSF
ncbi:IclR family transcriptional regulator [Subtercola endophyticus]|uniref:IclR family transcriptional regulator n=1 Tax=Subtercola endophyticus TaxID=2895559 RepID=UPI001E47C63E|nr:IclR family transcriptional regulator [Subtercola endophyticus]UFS58560.1 IclR family transcriptional regulator [Subtercola endophyticus]